MPTTLSDKIESYNAAQVRKLRSRYRYELDIADAGETVSPPPLPAWVDKVGDVSSFYADVRVPMAGGAVGTALQYVGTEGESQQGYITEAQVELTTETGRLIPGTGKGARRSWGTQVLPGRSHITRSLNAGMPIEIEKFITKWIDPGSTEKTPSKSFIFLLLTQLLMPTGIVFDVCGTPRSTIVSTLEFLEFVSTRLRMPGVWPLAESGGLVPTPGLREAVVFYTHFKS